MGRCHDIETMDVLVVLLFIPEVKHSYEHNPSKCLSGKVYFIPIMLLLLKTTHILHLEAVYASQKKMPHYLYLFLILDPKWH